MSTSLSVTPQGRPQHLSRDRAVDDRHGRSIGGGRRHAERAGSRDDLARWDHGGKIVSTASQVAGVQRNAKSARQEPAGGGDAADVAQRVGPAGCG
ncbi:MAG: hypothetical protein IT318_11365 [Anaerolineales bacterium]|nr:hypothetical protein [Anaerolineales bacterium]